MAFSMYSFWKEQLSSRQGRLLDHCFHALPQMAYSGSLPRGGGLPLSYAVGGSQIGSQVLTRRSALLPEIWRGFAPACGVGVGGID